MSSDRPPGTSDHLSSLLSQLQGASPQKRQQPALATPPAPSQIDALFRTLSPSASAASPTSPPDQGRRQGLLDIFNTSSPSFGVALSPPLPQGQPAKEISAVAPGESLHARSPVSSTSATGGAGDANALLEMLRNGGPRSPPVASPGSGQLPSFARTSSASGNSLFGMLNRAGSPATTSAWAGAAVPTSPAVPLPTRNAEDTLVMLADRSKAFDAPAEAHPAVPPKASQDSSVSLPDAVQPPLTANPEPASEKATTFNFPLAAAPVPAPTMFHFVSPFDAFGPTPKRSRSAAPPSPQVVDQQQPTPIARSASSSKLFSPDAPVPSPLAQEVSARAPVSSSVAAPPQPAIQIPESMPEAVRIPPPELARNGSVNSNSAIASPDLPSYKGRSDSFTSTRLGHTRSASGSLRVSKGDIVIGGTLRPRKLEEEEKKRNKGVSHAGPLPPKAITSPDTVVDLSLANLDSFVQDSLQTRPITIVKTDLIYTPGRTVGGTQFISYAMNKGRLRVLDESSTGRMLLKLPAEWYPRDASVADLAIHGDRIAAVTTDGGVIVWQLSPGWAQDETKCRIVFAVAPASDETSALRLVKWHANGAKLCIMSARNVFILNFEPISTAWIQQTSASALSQSTLVSAHPDVDVFDAPDGSDDAAQKLIACFSVLELGDGVIKIIIVGPSGAYSVARISAQKQIESFDGRFSLPGPVSSVELLDAETFLVSCNQDTALYLFSTLHSTAQPVRKGSFVLKAPEDVSMFGKLAWDAERRIIWLANSARSSLFVIRVTPECQGPAFERFAEFSTQPLTSFCLTTASSANGNDFEALTVAPHGVDQIFIPGGGLDFFLAPIVVKKESKEDEEAVPLAGAVKQEETEVSVPPPVISAVVPAEDMAADIKPDILANGAATVVPAAPSTKLSRKKRAAAAAITLSASASSDAGPVEPASVPVNIPAADEPASGKGVEALNGDVSKEVKKVEENICSKVQALIEKQSIRLEANDLKRQEKVLKLLSSELKTNTTSVVTNSVKAEIRNTVLPAIREVTKTEIASIVQLQISKGLETSLAETLPAELERHLNSRAFASVVFPHIDKSIKDLIHKTLVPAYNAATTEIYEALSREIRADMVDIRKEVVMEQSNALIETNALVTNMSKTVLTLASQVVELQNLVTSLKEQVAESAARQPPPERQPKALSPAVVPSSTMTATSSASSHRPGSSILQPAYAAYPQPPSQPVPPLPQPMAFPPPSTAPQQAPPSLPGHSHPSSQHTLHHAPPIISSQQKQNHPLSPSTQPQLGMSQQDAAKDAEDTWTEAFMSRDPDALGKLLSRLSPSVLDRVLPDAPQGSLLSQAVILTTIHKFSDFLSRTPLQSNLFPPALVIVQRACRLLDSRDPTIVPYASRVIEQTLPVLAKVESSILRSAGSGGIGEREREQVVGRLRAAGATLAAKR